MYSTVNHRILQRAFVRAHRASENGDYGVSARKAFREIARLIWDAHGEQPTEFPTSAQLDAIIADTASDKPSEVEA